MLMRRHFRTAGVLGTGALLLLAASLAAALAPLGWPFELFVHFRWQLAATVILLGIAALLTRAPRSTLLVAVAGALQLVPLAWRLPTPPGASVGNCDQPPAVRIVSLNLQFRNDGHARVLRWLDEHPADVVVLQEVTTTWESALAATTSRYPHRVLRVRADSYGIGLLSRWPLERVQALDLAGDGLPSLAAVVRIDDAPLQVYALHTPWPLLPRLQRARDATLERIAPLARASRLPTVLAGDLNLTPFAPAYARLLARSGLRDALGERWWRPTWRAGIWPLALPIDHVLVSASLCATQAWIGPDLGSDHRPLLVELRSRRGGGGYSSSP